MDLTNLFSMDIVAPILIGMGAVLIFRMMPRLIAKGVPFVTPKDLRARLDRGEDVMIVDVRSEREFSSRAGRVPHSLNLPLDQLARRLAEAGSDLRAHLDTPVFVICQTSSRAAHAARLLRKAGFRDLSIVSGGMSAWRGQGHPVEQGPNI